MIRNIGFLLCAGACLSACASTKPVVPPIAEVRPTFEAPVQAQIGSDYVLGPGDKVAIRTFREPDLSLDEVLIDDSGRLAFPLVGSVEADGLTAQQLAEMLEMRLGGRYLRDPNVTVQVKEANSRVVVVEGAVMRPGVYPINRKTTLLTALAQASGPSDIASLSDIVIFRTINGQRMAALFNVHSIRRGLMDDPQILPNDTVVISYSNGRRLYQDLLKTTPLIAAVFRPLTD